MCFLGAVPARAGNLKLTLDRVSRAGTFYGMIIRDPTAFTVLVCEENRPPAHFTWCRARALAGDERDEVIAVDLSNHLRAIKAFVDENNKRKQDIAMPGADELTAFGNDARAFFGSPPFLNSAIEINGTKFHRVALKE